MQLLSVVKQKEVIVFAQDNGGQYYQNKDTIFINVPVTKEEAYEKTVYHWSIIVLGNYFDRSADGVCV